MGLFKRIAKFFADWNKKELVCRLDEETGKFYCCEVKQGGYVRLPGGPYTEEECEARRQGG